MQADKLEEEQQKRLGAIKYRQMQLLRRLNDANFYGSGTKTDEIVDFRTWLAEADRLGVFLSYDELRKLIALDIFRYEILNNFPNAGSVDVQMQRVAEQKVRENSPSVNVAPLIRKGLMDEYRVRIAKLAAVELQLATYDRNLFKRLKPTTSYMPSELTRLALTPAQIFDFYVDNRTELDVALLEIPVESFVGQVGEPDAKTLEMLFNKDITSKDGSKSPAKAVPFDPASPNPGFRNPHLMKVKWVSGDPSSPFFKTIARVSERPRRLAGRFDVAADAAGGRPAVLRGRPGDSRRPARSGVSRRQPASDCGNGIESADHRRRILEERPGSDDGELHGSSTDPVAIAALFGATARPDGVFAAVPLFTEDGAVKHKTAIEEAVRIEAKRRAPIIASLVGKRRAGTAGAARPTISRQQRASRATRACFRSCAKP